MNHLFLVVILFFVMGCNSSNKVHYADFKLTDDDLGLNDVKIECNSYVTSNGIVTFDEYRVIGEGKSYYLVNWKNFHADGEHKNWRLILIKLVSEEVLITK